MKGMLKMSRIVVLAVFTVGALAAQAAKIEQVIVRQQWPWSTDVKVEYRLSGVTAPVDIGVTVYNGEAELPLPASAIVGDLHGIDMDGVGQFVIDPVAAFGTTKVALANFKVKLSLVDSAANISEVIYKVFDLENGGCTDIRRADLLDGKYGSWETDFTKIGSDFRTSLEDVLIWTGVTNDVAYKTTKLVMRKIPAKDVVWTMGSPATELGRTLSSETNHLVKLTHDYFIGVFPITQKQYYLMTGSHTAKAESQAKANADVLPENNMMYGSENSSNPCALIFLPKIRQKTGVDAFAVPTEAEWEFACRAGTTSALYSGKEVSNLWSGLCPNVDEIAWYRGNCFGAGVSEMPVGGKLPNAFGLYDMIGNVSEFCSDYFSANMDYVASFGDGWHPSDVIVDPVGPAESPDGKSTRAIRGCGIYLDAEYYGACMRSAWRGQGLVWSSRQANGLRVIFKVDK